MSTTTPLPHLRGDRTLPGESSYEQLHLLLAYATLAPSVHNTQPWLFEVEEERVALHADRDRLLAVGDPDGRELTISCGAALFHLQIAIRYFGHDCRVQLLPEGPASDLLAYVYFGEPRPATPEEDRLFHAFTQRHTARGPYSATRISDAVTVDLIQAAATEGNSLHLMTDPLKRQQLVELVTEADRLQMANSKYRRELASHLHTNMSDATEGIPGYALGEGTLTSLVSPWLIRYFNLGQLRANTDLLLLEKSPILATLASHKDTPLEWIKTGQALARLLLTATAKGLSASFFNQAVELPHLRTRLRNLLKPPHFPQIVLRLGYGERALPSPRRSVTEVLKKPRDN